MAQFMKLLVTIALTFAVTTAIITTTTTITNPTTEKFAPKDPFKDLTSPEGVKIRPSRFLAQKDVEGQEPKARNRNAAERCNKDSEICCSTGANSTMACCNSKCMDLSTDKKNCDSDHNHLLMAKMTDHDDLMATVPRLMASTNNNIQSMKLLCIQSFLFILSIFTQLPPSH
ncbi:unnamed protein product [Brassica oleracea var. botrytis]|uniref:Uncharacterized protein n=2 Tax=Brassica oleracea TaxID=3712 RepID=A0A0D3B3E2_BRAOL|nr:unnamed protein product [Brassica oleracea]